MILLMFSGGLDSTGVLYKLLTESTEPLHVHHIVLRNVEKRGLPEHFATQSIVKLCKEKFRDFKYTTSTYEFEQFSFMGWDNDIIRFIAAQICRGDPQITQLALGKCVDDDHDATFRVRALQATTIWRACFIDTPNDPPEIIRPVGSMTKKQIWDMLPEEVRSQIWSCRTPVQNGRVITYCKKCKTCLQLIHHGISKP